jgi:uncharacterized protein YheU (UPF0270 family)
LDLHNKNTLKCLVKRNIKIAGTDSGTAAYDLSEIVQDVAFKYNIYILFESAREFLKKKKKNQLREYKKLWSFILSMLKKNLEVI